MSTAQPELFALEDVEGYSTLGRKERLFAQALFEGCSQRDAAKRAGVQGTDEVVDVAASKLVRSAKVQSLMNQAWAKAGANIDATLYQATQLQMRTFREAIEAQNPQRRKEAFTQWRQASELIASIHGKLRIKIEGNVNHNHAVTPELREQLLNVQREMEGALSVSRN